MNFHKFAKYKIIILLGTFFFSSVFAKNLRINGAGATFPYPLYAKWAQIYHQQSGIQLNYQAIGSGGGIKQIQAKTVDFGATDKPLTSAELKSYGLVQFPTILGAVVPIVNIPELKTAQLKLSGEILAHIYLGKIKKWNDPLIQKLNPDIHLPNQAITVVHRSDGSGTTFLFTHYLNQVSSLWKNQVGSDAAIDWPTGIGGKGNEGVSAFVQRIKGSIGYVEYSYSKQGNLITVLLQNKSGYFVAPSLETFEAAASHADWKNTPNFAEILTNEDGDKSWPILGASFVLLHTIQKNPVQGIGVLSFFNWAYHHGKAVALQLDYIPLSNDLVKLIEDSWRTQIKDPSGKAIWK